MMTLSIIFGLVFLAIIILNFVSIWIVFEKAGKPGWSTIVPFYNIIVFLEIIGKPWWWLLLMLIPYLNLIWVIWSANLFVKKFGDTNILSTIGFCCFPYIYIPLLL